MQVFFDICRYAREKGLLVIADAKRGDIETTASAYARGFLGEVEIFGQAYPIWDVDAITINPYLGSDSVKPFLQEAAERGKGVFVVVRTSNPSAGEIQDLQVNGERLFQRVGRMVKEWGRGMIGESGFSSVGAVVGATYPQEMTILRRLLPEIPFLIPGLGFQGAMPRDVSSAFNRQGLGGLVVASRSIIFAHFHEPWKSQFPSERWTDAVKASTHQMIAEIRRALAEPNREVVF
jgi:orotidine-5'-phosphate decarboxylase